MTTEIRRDVHFVVLQTGRAMPAAGADRAYKAGWGDGGGAGWWDGGVVQTECARLARERERLARS